MPSPLLPPLVLTHSKIQCTAVLGLGVTYLISSPNFIHTLERTFSAYLPFLPATPSYAPSLLSSPLLAQQQHITGLVTVGIGFGYFLSLYHRQYEFLYMSVPTRLALSGIGLVTWLVAPERFGVTMALIVLNDGLGAALAGWALGWDGWIGRMPGWEGKRQ